jgi:translation elongation factor EF-Ts
LDARCCTRQSKGPKFAELCRAIAMQVAASPTVDFVRTEDISVEVRDAERRAEMMSEDLAGKNEEIKAKMVREVAQIHSRRRSNRNCRRPSSCACGMPFKKGAPARS